ncbi:hypothetical protein [Aquamicrobium sp. LC103]|uniref:hypothetical protein n=1 Tax=Aquamicrobium sp. LC103 TaxID=1120658 RepID=UPI00063E9D09|nr:hypothetical protein [Aquamicrobium sp. LC103]TKT74730.1 hypothetical protein XW59_022645 [Aquamicrobium sp. LC103]
MSAFETCIIRHTDSPLLHYTVEFIGGNAQSVTVDCTFEPAESEPSHEEIVAKARRLIEAVMAESGEESRPGTDFR